MKRTRIFLGAIAAIALVATTALAGAKWTNPVIVTSYGNVTYAYGALGSARASADTLQYIGCQAVANKEYAYVSCFARSPSGTYAYCYNRENAGMLTVVTGITHGSYVTFSTDPTDSTKCASIEVQAASAFMPPTP